MKKMILAFALIFSVIPHVANADFWDVIGGIYEIKHPRPQPSRPNYPGYGDVTCTYTDTGWEEHYRGHNSCGECLREHGNCIETCSIDNQICEAKGYDRYGQLVTVTGESPDRWEAERRAYDSCYYRGLRDCRIEKCESREERVSQRNCRR